MSAVEEGQLNLEQENAHLKERLHLVETQLGYYKYRCRILKMAQVNDSDKTITVTVVRRPSFEKSYLIPENFKLITFKRVLFDDIGVAIPDLTVKYKENILQNEFTLRDYLIEDGATLEVCCPTMQFTSPNCNFEFQEDDTVKTVRESSKFAGFLVQDDSGAVISDDVKIADLDPKEVSLRKYKVILVSNKNGSEVTHAYAVDNIPELDRFGLRFEIAPDSERKLAENKEIRLRSFENYLIKIDASKEKEVESAEKLSFGQICKMFNLQGLDGLELYDPVTDSYIQFPEDVPLGSIMNAHFQAVQLRQIKSKKINFAGKNVTIKYHEGMTEDELVKSLDTTNQIYFCSATTREICNFSWKNLDSIIAVRYVAQILHYKDKTMHELGFDTHDKRLKWQDLISSLDPLLLNPDRNTLEITIGAQQTLASPNDTIWSKHGTLLEDEKTCKVQIALRFDLSRLSEKSSNRSVLVDQKHDIHDLRRLILDLHPRSKIRCLMAKKSHDQAGYVNLERYPEYELLLNCITDDGYDMIFYEVQEEKTELSRDQDSLDLEHKTYVAEYDKSNLENHVEGVLKAYTSHIY